MKTKKIINEFKNGLFLFWEKTGLLRKKKSSPLLAECESPFKTLAGSEVGMEQDEDEEERKKEAEI